MPTQIVGPMAKRNEVHRPLTKSQSKALDKQYVLSALYINICFRPRGVVLFSISKYINRIKKVKQMEVQNLPVGM